VERSQPCERSRAAAGPRASLPDHSPPDAPGYPIAEVVAAPPTGVPVKLISNQQEKHGSVYTLTGDVRIDYKDYILTADKVSYDRTPATPRPMAMCGSRADGTTN
jgi:LPS-assembly protein